MRKQIFQAICIRLAEQVPDIQFIDLWNNNVENLNDGAVWPQPAVFIEFETIEWRQQNNGARRSEMAVRLHIITQAVNTSGHDDPAQSEALAFFDLIDRINAAMQGLRGDNFSGFMLTTSVTNHEHSELIESIERYITGVQDTTAVSLQATTSLSTDIRS